jgi:hypothetical protein
MVPVGKSHVSKSLNQQEKQSLIRKIFLYASFNNLLNIDNYEDNLYLITQLIKKGRLANLETLKNYFTEENLNKKTSEQIKCDEKFLSNLIQTLHCLTWSEKDIAEMKSLGRKIVLKAHPDKGHFNDTSKISTEITEFLMNNSCGGSLHNLFENKKEYIHRAQDIIIANNYYPLMANKFLGGAMEQIGYQIGTKLVDKIIPLNQRKQHILCDNFETKSQINKLLIESELNKYPQQHLPSKVKQ